MKMNNNLEIKSIIQKELHKIEDRIYDLEKIYLAEALFSKYGK